MERSGVEIPSEHPQFLSVQKTQKKYLQGHDPDSKYIYPIKYSLETNNPARIQNAV